MEVAQAADRKLVRLQEPMLGRCLEQGNMTLTRLGFWITLGAMFLVLAVVTYRRRQRVKKVQFPFAS